MSADELQSERRTRVGINPGPDPEKGKLVERILSEPYELPFVILTDAELEKIWEDLCNT